MYDWLKKKPATFSSNQKQNQKSHDSLARVLPRVTSDTCVYFDWLRYYGVWLAQKTPPLCHPIRSKTKKTRVSLADHRLFITVCLPRFVSFLVTSWGIGFGLKYPEYTGNTSAPYADKVGWLMNSALSKTRLGPASKLFAWRRDNPQNR